MVIIGHQFNFEQKKQMKFKEATKGKGVRTLFRKAGYSVYLVDEFRTSCKCSKCMKVDGVCNKFLIKDNPRPYRKNRILCHGLTKCKICGSLWNRDRNGASNIYKIAYNAIHGLERPLYLKRNNSQKLNDFYNQNLHLTLKLWFILR